LFLEKFVNCFDEAPQLLKLYRDQSDLAKWHGNGIVLWNFPQISLDTVMQLQG
jgi:hypothetical protein